MPLTGRKFGTCPGNPWALTFVTQLMQMANANAIRTIDPCFMLVVFAKIMFGLFCLCENISLIVFSKHLKIVKEHLIVEGLTIDGIHVDASTFSNNNPSELIRSDLRISFLLTRSILDH